MSRSTAAAAALLLLLASAAAVAAAQLSPTAEAEAEALRYRRRRRSRRGGRPGGGTRSAPPPPPPLIPLPTPPSPPAARTPPVHLLPCNRSVVPIMVGPGAPQPTTASSPACLATPTPTPTPPSPPSPPTPPQPPRCPRCPPCARRPARPVFLFPPGKPAPGGSGSSSGGGLGEACVAPLAGLMTCGEFLTGGSDEATPTPRSDCCVGLGAFLNRFSAAGGGDRLLRCLCPVILGEVNRNLPKPVDPVRLMYLPIACGVVLPPQVLYVCFTGQTPRFGSRIPALADLS